MSSVNIQVTGKVQGVSYRYSTKKKAKSVQLTGWVKNLPDGSVQIYAQGADSSIASLIEWCHHGPASAIVKDVIVEELNKSPAIHLKSFEIIR